VKTGGDELRNDDSDHSYTHTDPSDLPFPSTQDYQAIDQRLESQDPPKSPDCPESQGGCFIACTRGVEVFHLMVNNDEGEVEQDKDRNGE